MATVTQQTTAKRSREETEPQRSGGHPPLPGRTLPQHPDSWAVAPPSVPAWPKAGPMALHSQGMFAGGQRIKKKKVNSASKKFGRHRVKQNQKGVFVAGLLRALRTPGWEERATCSRFLRNYIPQTRFGKWGSTHFLQWPVRHLSQGPPPA